MLCRKRWEPDHLPVCKWLSDDSGEDRICHDQCISLFELLGVDLDPISCDEVQENWRSTEPIALAQA